MTETPLQHLFRLAKDREVPLAELRPLATAASCSCPHLTDQLSMQVARAFDDGKYRRPKDAAHVDPVERYTRPRIKAILARG